jgi:hypothetical protein
LAANFYHTFAFPVVAGILAFIAGCLSRWAIIAVIIINAHSVSGSFQAEKAVEAPKRHYRRAQVLRVVR